MNGKGRGTLQKRIKQSKNESNTPMVICIGVVVGWIVTIIMCLITSAIIISGENRENLMIPSSIIIMIVSSLIIGIVISKMTQRKNVIFSIIGGCCYLVTLLSVNAMIYDGMYSGIWYHALAIMGSTLAGALVISAIPNRKNRYKIR